MGSKITARQNMKDAGVPIVPGIEEGISDPDEAAKIAEEIGYPIILKPAAGGGGIGMKIVYNREDLQPALASSQSVARNNFGDDTIYIEKYLTDPRHIEFQILADNNGKDHLCLRPRVLHPAPPPEADRGVPFAGHD